MINMLALFSDILIRISPAMVFVTSLIALWQIIIVKNSIITQSKREAVSLAADKCEQFARVLLPKHTQHISQGFIPVPSKLKNNKFSVDSLEDSKGGEAWIEDLRVKGNLLKAIDFLNEIEALSMYFANGAADEKVACTVIGTVFCQWVEEYAPLIIKLRENSLNNINSVPYQNTINLYDIWVDRLSKSKLQKEIDVLTIRKQEIKDKGIKAIGT